jgi:hypothetical protein
MFTRSTTALSAALVLATACIGPAVAKDRHHQRHGATVVLSASRDGFHSYGLAPITPGGTAGRIEEPAYMRYQTEGLRRGG